MDWPNLLVIDWSLAATLGYTGFLLSIISYQAQSVRTTNLIWAPMDLIYAFHFFLMGESVLAAHCLAASFRDLGMTSTHRHIKIMTIVFYFIVSWIIAFTGATLIAYIAALGTTLSTIAMALHGHFIWSRLLIIVNHMLWAVIAFITGSMPIMLHISCSFFSNIISIIRYINKDRVAQYRTAQNRVVSVSGSYRVKRVP